MNLEEAEKVLNEIGVNIKDNEGNYEGNYRNFLEVLQDIQNKFEMLNGDYVQKVFDTLGV